SNLSGRMSLYRMRARAGGSVPEPLLPPDLALQNPSLLEGSEAFYVFPAIGQVLVMLDHDGDEVYQPMRVPLSGGFPAPAFGEQLANYRVHAHRPDIVRNIIYFVAESRSEALIVTFRGHVASGTLDRLAESVWGMLPDGVSADHTQLVLNEGYTVGDTTLYWLKDGQRQGPPGTPLQARLPGQVYPPEANHDLYFTGGNRGLLLVTALHTDTYGLGYLDLGQAPPARIEPVQITGLRHTGAGELEHLNHLRGNRYWLTYD